MFNSLYFKIILILVIFIITVMCVIGTILINSVNNFYMDEFTNLMDKCFEKDGQLITELTDALQNDRYASEQYIILNYSRGILGIDDYRDFYVLSKDGEYLTGSDPDSGSQLRYTANLLAAMRGKADNKQSLGADFADYAVSVSDGDRTSIIYIKDSMEEMQQFTWILFSIILQALMFGLIFAIILAFFLSKAITSPIQSLTKSAKLVASGEFTEDADIRSESHSHDEISTLTDTFNDMKKRLKSTLDEVSGEHQKLETLFTYLRDGVAAFYEDGSVMNINESLKNLLGSEYRNDFDLRKLLTLFQIDYNPDFQVEYIDREHYNGDSNNDSFNVSDVMFHDRVLDISFGRLRYTAEHTLHTGLLMVIHDETGRYELDKSRREFVANVSHEMRTPLTSIRGACETILNATDMAPDMENFFLTMAVDECDRMTHIVSDLLVLSRLDNKRTKWNIQSVDIDTMLTHIMEVMKVDAASHSHTLTYAKESLPLITADKERMEQVIINIVSNAIKYTPDGGEISIFAKETVQSDNSHRVLIRVSDNGIGIPEEDIPHLFERFYRVEKSRTSETGGTGLGLAIAKEIVEAHGGSISVESTLNIGTTVTILLPLETRLQTQE